MLQKPDITEEISRVVELKKAGVNFKACCPFHEEKYPSFVVNPRKQTFICYGCHERGDVIDFVKKYYGLSFNEALTHLGIKRGKISRTKIIEAQNRKQKKEEWEEWQIITIDKLSMLVRCCRKVLPKMSYRQFHEYGKIYNGFELWKYWLDIMLNGTNENKLELRKELEGKI